MLFVSLFTCCKLFIIILCHLMIIISSSQATGSCTICSVYYPGSHVSVYSLCLLFCGEILTEKGQPLYYSVRHVETEIMFSPSTGSIEW